MDPFYVLGLNRNADTGQIRAAYRKQARIAHPDRGGSDLDFFHLTEAYQIALKHRSARRRRANETTTGQTNSNGTDTDRTTQLKTNRTGATGSGSAPAGADGSAGAASTEVDGSAEDWTEAAALRRQFYHWRRAQAWRRVARGPLVLMLSIQVVLLTVIALVQPSSPLPVVAGALAAGLIGGLAATAVAADRVGLLDRSR